MLCLRRALTFEINRKGFLFFLSFGFEMFRLFQHKRSLEEKSSFKTVASSKHSGKTAHSTACRYTFP